LSGWFTRKFGEDWPRIDRKNDALTEKFGDEWLMNDWWMTDEWTEELAKMDRKLNDELTDNCPIFTRLIYPKFWAKIWQKSTEGWPKNRIWTDDEWRMHRQKNWRKIDRKLNDELTDNWTIVYPVNWPMIDRWIDRKFGENGQRLDKIDGKKMRIDGYSTEYIGEKTRFFWWKWMVALMVGLMVDV
jgi:hypothetical protein